MRVSIRLALLMSATIGSFCTAMDAADETSDEVHFADLRLGYGVPLGSMNGTYQAAGNQSQVDRVTWSQAGEMSLKWVPSLLHATESGSGLMALGISSTRYQLSDNTNREKIDQRLVLATVDLGLAWSPASDWTIEGAWHLGIGQARQPGNGTGSGSAWAVGINTEITRRLWRGFFIGLRGNIEWRAWNDSAMLDGISYDVAFRGLQFIPGVIVGWRF